MQRFLENTVGCFYCLYIKICKKCVINVLCQKTEVTWVKTLQQIAAFQLSSPFQLLKNSEKVLYCKISRLFLLLYLLGANFRSTIN